MLNRAVFGIGKNYLCAVEIGKSCLKVSQAELSSQGLVISKLITRSVSDLSDDEISKALAEIINTNHIRLDRLIAVISRDRVMLRYLRLPATRAEEIENMLSFEVARQIPYTKEEVIYDYEITGTDSRGYSEIMLAIVHKNEAAKLNNILASIGKRPDQIRLSSEAILSWLKTVPEEGLSQNNLSLLDIDTDSTEIVIISDGKLEFSRLVSIGAARISQGGPGAGSWRTPLIEEINRSIGMYIREKGQDASAIKEFLVSGAGSVGEDLARFIKEQTGKTCRSLNILRTLPLSDRALPKEGILPHSSVAALCGSLFLSEGLNLIPAESRRKEKAKTRTRRLMAVSISAGVGVVLLSSAALARLYQKEGSLTRMKNMLSKIEPQTKATEDKLKKLRVVKQQLSEGATSLDAIYHLYRLIPASISLIDFDYEDENKVVSFRGTAARMSDVFNLAKILEESESFGNVQTRSASKRVTKNGEVVDFQIRCNFMVRDVP